MNCERATGAAEETAVGRTQDNGLMELTRIGDAAPPAAVDVERRRAWQKVAVFLGLVIAFSTSLYLLRLLVPFGTELIAVTWTPRLADGLGMWSVGLAGLIALAV